MTTGSAETLRPGVRVLRALGAAVALAALGAACGGGGGGGSSSPSAPTSPTAPGGVTTPTVTIGASGVEPKQLRIDVNQRVQFVNRDSRNHEMASNPHPLHTECPPLNDIGMLAPGQSRNTGLFERSGTCRFHDHMNPDDSNFHGTILIAVEEPGPGPGYRTTQ